MPNSHNELLRSSVDALGVETSFLSAGRPDGEPVILLHGMSSSAETYRELLQNLDQRYHLIAPDLPGFGLSAMTRPYAPAHLVEWLAAFIQALNLGKVRIVGHSFGGVLAATFALSYPEDVSQLLLLAPALLAGTAFPDLLMRAGISLGLVDLGTAVSQSRARVGQQVKLGFYDPERQPNSMWARQIKAYEQSRASSDVVKAIAFHDLRPQLDQLAHPVCIVWGEEDPVLPARHGHILAGIIPDVQVHILPECGHVIMLEKQQETAAVASAFFGNHDVRQALLDVGQATIEGHDQPVIAVFGSSAPIPGSRAYQDAYETGRLLAESGLAVATGGYAGTMTAVSHGASEAGGHVIGVTCDQIEHFRQLGPNEWISQEVRYETLRGRLLHLITHNEGMIVLPGGIGTISEMTLAWSFLQVGEIPPRPLSLLGDMWRQTIDAFVLPEYVHEPHLELLHFADSPESAVGYVAARALVEKL